MGISDDGFVICKLRKFYELRCEKQRSMGTSDNGSIAKF
jgi:hypothetical protein